ncbi:MAG: hypothetical protein J5973_05310 [Eubacterium sp.]|nr:hypothetical protein [Eubacterium sp.]
MENPVYPVMGRCVLSAQATEVDQTAETAGQLMILMKEGLDSKFESFGWLLLYLV